MISYVGLALAIAVGYFLGQLMFTVVVGILKYYDNKQLAKEMQQFADLLKQGQVGQQIGGDRNDLLLGAGTVKH